MLGTRLPLVSLLLRPWIETFLLGKRFVELSSLSRRQSASRAASPGSHHQAQVYVHAAFTCVPSQQLDPAIGSAGDCFRFSFRPLLI